MLLFWKEPYMRWHLVIERTRRSHSDIMDSTCLYIRSSPCCPLICAAFSRCLMGGGCSQVELVWILWMSPEVSHQLPILQRQQKYEGVSEFLLIDDVFAKTNLFIDPKRQITFLHGRSALSSLYHVIFWTYKSTLLLSIFKSLWEIQIGWWGSTPFMRYVVKIKVCIKNKVHFGGQSDGELHLRIMFHMSWSVGAHVLMLQTLSLILSILTVHMKKTTFVIVNSDITRLLQFLCWVVHLLHFAPKWYLFQGIVAFCFYPFLNDIHTHLLLNGLLNRSSITILICHVFFTLSHSEYYYFFHF